MMRVAGVRARGLAQGLRSVLESTHTRDRQIASTSERITRSLEEASTSEQPVTVRGRGGNGILCQQLTPLARVRSLQVLDLSNNAPDLVCMNIMCEKARALFLLSVRPKTDRSDASNSKSRRRPLRLLARRLASAACAD